MKVVLIGASGFVGASILEELLQRGHQVTAIARHADKIKPSAPNLSIKALDVLNTDDLTAVIQDHDTVISAFNPGWTNPNIYVDFIAGAEAIQSAVKKSNVDRLIIVGGAGSLEVDGKQLVDGPEFPPAIKPGATAARDYFNTLKLETDLKWTFFSPAIEMHPGILTGRTGQYRLGTNNPVFDENGRCMLSVQDLAVVIADELENDKHSQQRFTAAY